MSVHAATKDVTEWTCRESDTIRKSKTEIKYDTDGGATDLRGSTAISAPAQGGKLGGW
jgi:hypothetical protein